MINYIDATKSKDSKLFKHWCELIKANNLGKIYANKILISSTFYLSLLHDKFMSMNPNIEAQLEFQQICHIYLSKYELTYIIL